MNTDDYKRQSTLLENSVVVILYSDYQALATSSRVKHQDIVWYAYMSIVPIYKMWNDYYSDAVINLVAS